MNRLSAILQLASNSLDTTDKCGPLELRGFKNKLYVVVAGDKVFLYKNAEVCTCQREPCFSERSALEKCKFVWEISCVVQKPSR